MPSNIPILRVYLIIDVSHDHPAAASIGAFKYTLTAKGHRMLYQRVKRGAAKFGRQPFIANEIGFELHEYDLNKFEAYTDQLFLELRNNQSMVKSLTQVDHVFTSFVININSMNDSQRPVYFLNPEQTMTLASIGSAISFDGYLMF